MERRRSNGTTTSSRTPVKLAFGPRPTVSPCSTISPTTVRNPMKKLIFCSLLLLILDAVRATSFTLEDTISLPGVKGRIDHFVIVREGCRLFVAALGTNPVKLLRLKDKQVITPITRL